MFARRLLAVVGAFAVLAASARALGARGRFIQDYLERYRAAVPVPVMPAGLAKTLSDAALAQTRTPTVYDPAYVKLAYPGGDVPPGRGVCTDVIVRAYRKAGVDLQVEVHEEMAAHFAAYPKMFHRDGPDPSIDHRRVPNLMVFFRRAGAAVPITAAAEDYRPGDVVAYDLGGATTHIGMVVAEAGSGGKRRMIVHNIGNGPRLEDALFDWKIIGHYRYAPRTRRPK